MQQVQLKISHKGLILVAVPLIFEIVFVISLVHMLRTAEEVAAQTAHSKAVVACASDLDRTVGYAGYALSGWKATQSARFIKRYDSLVARAEVLRRNLTELCKDDDRLRRHAARLNELTVQVIMLTSNFCRPNDSAMLTLMDKATYLAQMQRSYEALTDETQKLIDEEEQVQAGGSTSELRSKTIINALIGIFLLVSIVLTIVLEVFFSKSITNRLGVLTENTKRMAQGNPLIAPMTRQDEIGQLDLFFHKMAQDLRDTEQRKQEFVAMITHDLRTPLTSMRTLSTTLAEGAADRKDEDDCQRIRVVQRNLDRMINLVNDLLSMDKIEAGLLTLDISLVHFHDVLESSLESIRHLAEQRELAISADNFDVQAEIDQKRIGQVLVNLLSNAIKYSRHGSTVTIDAKSDGTWLTVRVTDEGRGIPKEHIDKIFDRFKQVDKSDSTLQGGSGLGLAISKALIELHRGTIGVDSSPGKGSTFWFRLPLRQPRA